MSGQMRYSLVVAFIVVGNCNDVGSSYPAARRINATNFGANVFIGFRVVLYIS